MKESTYKQGLLRELNLKFPEERKKPYKLQDPEFQAQRNVILGVPFNLNYLLYEECLAKLSEQISTLQSDLR